MKLLLSAMVLTFALLVPAEATGGGPGACFSTQLRARAIFQGATGAQEGGVVLRNISARACVLNDRPSVAFVVNRSTVLDVRVTVDTTRTRTIAVLRPGRRAFVHIRWRNWCGKRYEGVAVWLWMRSVKPLVRARGAISPPRCDDSATASRVAVGPYEKRSA
jgi:hypothetical protein